MRTFTKPPVPNVVTPSYAAYAIALGNAVGRYCSFCEKALTLSLALFDKQRGVLALNATVVATDWPNLLLICGDCAACVGFYDPRPPYFWPDAPVGSDAPYLYNLTSAVPVTIQNPEGITIPPTTVDVVLVSLATDLDGPTTTSAGNTLNLFQLNGKFYNSSAEPPGYALTYSEYVYSTDTRMEARLDAYQRGVEAGTALAHAIPTLEFGDSYVRSLYAMVNLAYGAFGFSSTWLTAISNTLTSIDPNLLTTLGTLLKVDPSAPRGKKRREEEDAFEEAVDTAINKRKAVENILGQIIGVRG
jgi:hypothetical protein